MSTVYGTVSPFDPTTDEWSEYVERLQFYFTANGIKDDSKKRAVLLSNCGPSTFRLLRSIVLPAPLTDFSFSELVSKMKAHREPRPSVIVQRYQFNSRQRLPSESMAEYIAALRKLAEFCNYGESLDEMLRDRFVCGIAHSAVQKRLLAEPDLTLTKAVTVAQAVELAEKGAQQLQLPVDKETKEVHKFSTTNSQPHADTRKKDSSSGGKASSTSCYRCGGKHNQQTCRFKSETCHFCNKRGHIAKVCRSKKRQSPPAKPTNQVTQDPPESVPSEYSLFTLPGQQSKPVKVVINIEGSPVTMEVDTGAAVSIISDKTRNNMPNLQKLTLQPSPATLRTYTGETISVLGEILVKTKHNGQNATMPLLVVQGDGPSLIGRNWLAQIQLDWKGIFSIKGGQSLERLLTQHSDVFRDELGTVKDVKVKLYVKENSTPKFFKPRTLPLALREKVSSELDRLEKNSIITPVKHSVWAAPVVPVIKKDGSVRLCGDYKITVNSVAQNEIYPLPRIEELFAAVAGGKIFSKLDLSHAYLQLQLEEASQELVTINTHRGLYRYTRLPFGVSSAPAIFQRTMETLLRDLPMVVVYIDDILVAGRSQEEHLANLAQVLQRLEDAGMRLKKEKCSFCLAEVEYLGHSISAEGLRPSTTNVQAITAAPKPSKVSELKSFLGLVNYYAKFIPNLATTLAPLYKLLGSTQSWQWNKEQQSAFTEVKNLLIAPNLLAHYDDTKPLVLACDASPYGVGAVLSHLTDDHTERPIAYASRSLHPAERKYSQLDKEALAILFGVTKFHQYLFGRRFTIYSDHKPLMYIFGESKSIPSVASARVQRWALTLSAYTYNIKYKRGKDMCNADGLSRLPLAVQPENVPTPPETIALLEHLANVPLAASQIKSMTDRDPILTKVKQFTQTNWPNTVSDHQLQPYWHRRNEISVEDGILLWGSRVIVPPQARNRVIEEAHAAHIGITRMKSLTRQFAWWPKMDADLEDKVKSCSTCQMYRNNPPEAVLHPWEWPKKPWTRLHADYAGPFLGKMFLIIIDSYSKWMEVHITNSATSAITIDKMRSSFATFGLPEILVTDNGTNFTSAEFEEFLKANGIRHTRTAPYHPASNGLAERAVQSFKLGMKKITAGSLETRVARFLFSYRITPQTTTGTSPSELLLGHRLRCHLDFIRPNLDARVRQNQYRQKETHDYHAKDRDFREGDDVLTKNFSSGEPWLRGTIHKEVGPVSFIVKLSDGRMVNRHLDQLRENSVNNGLSSTADHNDQVSSQQSTDQPLPTDTNGLRRSKRDRNPPQRFCD